MTERHILGIKIPSLLPREGYSVLGYLRGSTKPEERKANKPKSSGVNEFFELTMANHTGVVNRSSVRKNPPVSDEIDQK